MEKLDATRLPKNIEAEQALIGAILANNKAFEKVSEFLKPVSHNPEKWKLCAILYSPQ